MKFHVRMCASSNPKLVSCLSVGPRELRPELPRGSMGFVELAHGRLGLIKCLGRFRTRLTQTGPKPTQTFARTSFERFCNFLAADRGWPRAQFRRRERSVHVSAGGDSGVGWVKKRS